MPHRQYLITNRKFWALTQEEVAKLAGLTRQAVSHYERQAHFPSFETALRLEIIFGKTPGHLFPAMYDKAEEAVMREAVAFREVLEGKNDPDSRKKLGLLDGMMERATQLFAV